MVLTTSGYDDGTIVEVIAFCTRDRDLLFGGKLVYGDEDCEEVHGLEGILSNALMDFAAEDGFSQVLASSSGFWDNIVGCLYMDCFRLFWSMKQDGKRQGSRLYLTVMTGFTGWDNN
ncbi:unnamed protein product [Vicia faba]|uniref:Uncharacterized protein n=1 Tax=Vicia faba TaxID=3906 RepID=A0AAV0YR09_VICFA|nr:unnamed protein product [Vicia faba]